MQLGAHFVNRQQLIAARVSTLDTLIFLERKVFGRPPFLLIVKSEMGTIFLRHLLTVLCCIVQSLTVNDLPLKIPLPGRLSFHPNALASSLQVNLLSALW